MGRLGRSYPNKALVSQRLILQSVAAPYVIGRDASVEGSTVTTHDVDLVLGHQAGDGILIAIITDGATTVTKPAGYEELVNVSDAALFEYRVWWKVAAGGETTVQFTTGTAVTSSHLTWAVRNASAPEAVTVGGNSQFPDPAAISPSGGFGSYLFLALLADDASAGMSLPAGYAQSRNSASVTNEISGGERSGAVTTENPGTFAYGLGPANFQASTIAFPVLGMPTLTDELGLVDSRTVVATYLRSFTEALGMTDSMVVEKTGDIAAQIDDTEGLTDSLTTVAAYLRTLSDNLGLTDSLSAVQSHVRTITDALGLEDSGDWYGVGGDQLNLTDSLTATQSHIRAITDALGLSDTRIVVQSHVRALSDVLGLSDTLAQAYNAARTFTDPIGLTDSLTYDHSSAGEVVRTDPLNLTDSITTASSTLRSFTDPASLLDLLTSVTTSLRTLTDPLNLTDSLSYQHDVGAIAHTATITDALGLTDPYSHTAAYLRDMTDAEGLTDSMVVETPIFYSDVRVGREYSSVGRDYLSKNRSYR